MAVLFVVIFFVVKQMTAYEMRISDWSSDVCSSDLQAAFNQLKRDIDDLTEYAKKAGWSPQELDTAITKARADYYKALPAPAKTPFDDIPEIGSDGTGIAKEAGEAADAVIDRWSKVRAANDNMIKSFADMARDVAGSLRGLVGNIKSGDWQIGRAHV